MPLGLSMCCVGLGSAFTFIGFLVVGFVLYEIVQPYLPRGVFDWKDVYGALIGGVACTLLVLLLPLVVQHNRVLIRL